MTLRSIGVSILLVAMPAGAATLDRIAVTVDQSVISERDIEEEIRIAAFLDGRKPDAASFSEVPKRAASDRLIDQYLVLQDAAVTRANLASMTDVAPLLAPIQARYRSAADFQAALAAAGITATELDNHLLAGLKMLRYTDLRFRPEVQISEEAERSFYTKLAAEAAEKKTPVGDFEQSRPQIEKLLTDQQVMDSLDRWLKMTRADARIVYREAVFPDRASQDQASPDRR